MTLYTIGFTQKSAEQFFSALQDMDLLLDIRLNGTSQLAGFAKANDLPYFLRTLCRCAYEHEPAFAPTKELLDNYKGKKIDWGDYEETYGALLTERRATDGFMERFSQYHNICLLCSEPTAEHCHRRLLAERLCAENPALTVRHI